MRFGITEPLRGAPDVGAAFSSARGGSEGRGFERLLTMELEPFAFCMGNTAGVGGELSVDRRRLVLQLASGPR